MKGARLFLIIASVCAYGGVRGFIGKPQALVFAIFVLVMIGLVESRNNKIKEIQMT